MNQMQQQGLEDGRDGYEFAAKPQALMPKGKYRDQNDPGYVMDKNRGSKGNFQDGQRQSLQKSNSDQMYESEEGFNQPQNTYIDLNDPIEDETQLIPDYYVDRPPTPEYKPKERGIDISTQIIDTELFDYELEVLPILQVIVGKICDQARMELIEDFEKVQLRKHKDEFVKKRNAELMVTQRLENAYLRRKEERVETFFNLFQQERRTFQHKLRRDQDKLVHKKFIARLVCKKALFSMKKNALDDLEDQGFLKDNLEINIKKDFIPWLFDEAIKIIHNDQKNKKNVDELINSYQIQANQEHKTHLNIENQRKKEELAKREVERLLKEDKKRRKAEWKRKLALQESREKIFAEIQKKIIQAGIKTENIFDVDIVDLFGDTRTTPIGAVFGGVLGQIWILLDVLDKLAITEQEKLDQQNIKEFLKKVLSTNVKNYLLFSIYPSKQEEIDEFYKQMEDNYAEFNNQKPEIVKNLVENGREYFSSTTLQHLADNLSQDSYNQLFKPILEFVFDCLLRSSIQEAADKQDNSQDKSKLNASQEQSFLAAKNRLQLQYSQIGLQQFNSFLRIRIPFYTEEEIQQQKEEEEQKRIDELNKSKEKNKDNSKDKSETNIDLQQVDNGNQQQIHIEEQDKPKDKYDEFVDVFNGQGYYRKKKQLKTYSRRYDIKAQGQTPIAFNPTIISPNKQAICIYDERIQLFLRLGLLKLLKEQFADKLKQISEEQVIEKCYEIDDAIEHEFIQEASSKIAIFDYDYE